MPISKLGDSVMYTCKQKQVNVQTLLPFDTTNEKIVLKTVYTVLSEVYNATLTESNDVFIEQVCKRMGELIGQPFDIPYINPENVKIIHLGVKVTDNGISIILRNVTLSDLLGWLDVYKTFLPTCTVITFPYRDVTANALCPESYCIMNKDKVDLVDVKTLVSHYLNATRHYRR